MDREFQTSFVPKKPILEKESLAPHRSNISGVVNLIALIVFIASILGAGGMYFYRSSLQSKITEEKVSLERAKAAFEPSLITELQELDKRMRAATQILNNHIAVSPIFHLLGEITLPTVRYTDFAYEFNKDNKNLVDIKMTGQAKGYNYIALEADLFGKNKFIRNPIFSDFTLDQQGNIDFTLTFSVDKTLVLYESFLERESSLGEEFDPNATLNQGDTTIAPTNTLPQIPNSANTTNNTNQIQS
jgi:hypothetical protein